jgi:iron(III) transport system substrate-binding protein
MRKKIFVVTALCLAVSSLVFAGGGRAARDSGSSGLGNSLVLYSSMTENDLENLLKGFKEKYPGIDVEVVNGSAGELTSRIAAESENPQGDIMWGALNTSDGDTYKDLFEHWLSDYESEIMDDYKSINGFYNLDHLSTIVFCVNTDLEKELGLNIRGYADLLDPKLRGRIVLSDPNSSSAAWNNVANIMAVYGHDSPKAWETIEGLLRNDMIIVTSSSVCFKAVADGEYVVGLTYEDGASTLLKSGAKNIKMVYPAEGASAFAFGCAVIKNAPHMEAAKAMVNYLQSAEGQSYLGNALGTLRFTNKNAKYNSPYLQATSEIKWVTRDIPWLIANKAQVLEHWNRLYTSIKR